MSESWTPKLKHHTVHCESCGRFTRGSTFIVGKDGSHQVCNIQCGINLIIKRERNNGFPKGPTEKHPSEA